MARNPLRQDLDFRFNSSHPCYVRNCMSGNLSVRREEALTIGGFDENFNLTVAFRYETDFARRIWEQGARSGSSRPRACGTSGLAGVGRERRRRIIFVRPGRIIRSATIILPCGMERGARVPPISRSGLCAQSRLDFICDIPGGFPPGWWASSADFSVLAACAAEATIARSAPHRRSGSSGPGGLQITKAAGASARTHGRFVT